MSEPGQTRPPGAGEGRTVRQTIALMAVVPDAISPLVRALPDDVLDHRAAVNEWSPREVLAHMVAVERGLRARLAEMASSSEPVAMVPIAPVESPASAAESLVEWHRLRPDTVEFLRSLTSDEFEKTGVSGSFGSISVAEHIVEWSYHDLDHFRQIQESVQAWLYPAIGGYRGLYRRPFG